MHSGAVLHPIATEYKIISQYYTWFIPGVTHWLDISVYKAMIRIQKAIELDQLNPIVDTVKYSSSAVDTLDIFYQIKKFWHQLDWPDAEFSYVFVCKVFDNILRCCVFYAYRMNRRVQGLRDVFDNNDFAVTQEWCVAINNIEYIRQSLSPFLKVSWYFFFLILPTPYMINTFRDQQNISLALCPNQTNRVYVYYYRSFICNGQPIRVRLSETAIIR